tara:strand:- start:164 stop:1264 length:1101 start_codon:yes stop_codon:yes gene_type:complete
VSAKTNSPRFLIQVLMTGLVVLMVCAAINVTVDVRGVYSGRDGSDDLGLSDYVTALRRQEHGLIRDMRLRETKHELLRQSSADCIVLGSSHVGAISRDSLPNVLGGCRNFVNLYLDGAVFEDEVAFLALIAETPTAKKVLIEVAPWSLRENVGARWRTMGALYDRGRAYFGLSPRPEAVGVSVDLAANLINFEYLKRNLEAGFAGRADNRFVIQPVAADHAGLTAAEAVTLPDGSREYSAQAMARLPLAWDQVGTGDFNIRKPYVNPRTAADFETILLGLRKRGIEPVLLLMPYHPKVLTCEFAPVCEAMKLTTEKVQDIAARLNITVVGGFDPRPFGIGQGEFFDYHHVLRGAVRKLDVTSPPSR